MNEMEMLIYEIQKAIFMCVEINEFLDTHPGDKTALDDYNVWCEKSAVLKMEYEEKYGPFNNFGYSKSLYPFEWIQSPWPWECYEGSGN